MDIIPLSELDKSHRQLIGGKGYALGQLISQGYNVPPGFCVTTIAAEALDDYGYPGKPLDTERTTVVLGNAMARERHYLTTLRISFPEYSRLLLEAKEFLELPAKVRGAILSRWNEVVTKQFPEITEDTMPGELSNILSGRVANVLNLRGPNFTADAACASTFAALDAAVEMLVAGHCDAVLTGGVDRNMGTNSFVKFSKIGARSATGTRPFGDGADGFVMGEGSAVFLLKRLADAERDATYMILSKRSAHLLLGKLEK